MSLTYAQLTDAIQKYLETDEASFVSMIDIFINQAEERIVRDVQLPAFRRIQTSTIPGGEQYILLPTDFLAQYQLAMIDGSGNYHWLSFRDPGYVKEAYQDDSKTGVPRIYGLWDQDTIIIGPKTDGSYTAELHYLRKPESIVTAGTTWLGNNAEMALLNACLVEGYTYLKGDAELLGVYNSRYEIARDRLKNLGEGIAKIDEYAEGQHRQAIT